MVNKFLLLINERDSKLEEHKRSKGESWSELFNYPEERFWYAKNISPLDQKIVMAANSIISKFNIPCAEAKTISDVYSNQQLIMFINSKDQNKEDILGN